MRSAIFFTALVASALAGPTGYRESCAQHCTQDNIFSYQPGRSYSYQYTVTTNTALLGDTSEAAQVYITAHAKIDVTSPCDHTLRLTEVSLDGSSHAEEMAAALTRADLRFSFQDGRVEELCAAPSEETWILNFKRGLLSAFQTSLTRPGTEEVQETDVLGVCLTNYQNKVVGDVLTLTKVKDLTSCSRRTDLASYLASTTYSTNSPVQNLPVLDSTSTCTQTVEGGILTEASCEETHTFRPFSSGRGGASTTANTRLKLVSLDGPVLAITEQQFVRKTPVFESATEASPQSQTETITTLLMQLDEVSHQEVRPEAPALFSRLVIALRGLNYPVLSRVYADTTETHTRKFLVDAMPLVGTAAAAAVVRDMYVNGDLTQEETDAWFTSLTFVKNPTSEMFTAIAPMLDTNPSQSAMLGTSALVNTFCKINSGCDADSGVQQVMRRIEAQLGSGCRAVSEDEKVKILVALKALGNAGHWVNANRVLQRCYTEDNDMEVRVAAIEAWRHTPCEYDRSNLLAAYQDEMQDSEVRIAAYLSVMTCPTPATVATVKDRLTSEGVNQVGSFVWTHLTNLQESAAPGKEWARVLLGEELLVNKFKTEALRFSRNYESSFFMKELNLGAAVESNVIFGSKSYLPRSGMLNLTLDLFGESVNLFEVGGRIEGFETYLERLFGPDGYFPEDTVAAAIKGMRQQKRETEATTLEEFLEEAIDEPRGSYYLRLFGNDVHYRHFRGLSGSGPALTSPLSILMELVRGGNVDYTKSYQLLDTHYSVATVAGLPLTLGAKSTATVALRMDGSFKAESFSDVLIAGHIRPSAAVQVDGVMMVDAHVTRAGVKVSSTAHTSTTLEGKVKINGGELVDMSFNTPREHMEIIDLDTKYFYVQDDQETEKERQGPLYTNCIPTFMGMAVCGEVAYPYSSSCFPSTLRTYFRKTDTQTEYKFRFAKSANEVSVLFDNPGAQVSRRVALNLQAQDKRLSMKLDSFLTNVEATGEYTWQDDKKAVNTNVVLDGRRFFLDAGLLTSSGDIIKVEPYLVWSAGDQEMLNVNGKALANLRENKYSINAVLSAIFFPRPWTFKASYESTTAVKTADLAITSPKLNMSVGGKMFFDDSSIRTDLTYEFGDDFRTNSDLLLKTEQEGDVTIYSSKMTITHSLDTDPILIEYALTLSPTKLNNKVHFNRGSIDFVAEEIWTHTYENGVRTIKGEVTGKCPVLGVDTFGSTEMIITPNSFLLNSMTNRKGNEKGLQTLLVDLQRDPGTALTGRINLEHERVSVFNANADFRKVNPGHYIGQVSIADNDAIRGTRQILDMTSSFADNSVPGTFDIKAEASINALAERINLSSVVYGSSQEAKFDLQTSFTNEAYGMKLEATPKSLLIDANLVKHVVVNAMINPQGLENSVLVNVEWDKEVNPDNTFKIEGKIQPQAFTAEFRFLDKQFFVSGRTHDEGLDVEAQWSPSQRVAAELRYSLHAASSLTAVLETTFPGWEKQSVDVTAALQGNEVTCRASATWKNSQQATLSVKGRLQPMGAVHAEAIFISTVTDLENLSITFDHQMAGLTVNSSLHGAWNDFEVNGSLELTPSPMGINGLAAFTSPFSQPFKAILNHQLQDTSLDSTFLATYGSTELVQLISNGRLSLAQGQHDVNLTLKLTTVLEAVPNLEATLQYTMDGTTLQLLVDGKAGQRKMMLNANGEKKVTGDSTSVSGNLRFLTPFTQPLAASFSHNHDGHSFTSQFEVTRIWSTYSFGSLKMHAEGHVHSEKDINLSAYISSPETKGSFSFIHKIENNNLTTAAKVYVNRELISITVTGTLDSDARLLNLEGDITSSFEGLQMKVKVDSRKDGNTQNTQVDLNSNTHHATLTHSFTATNILNWESVFTLNDQYSLKNKMMHVTEEYYHQMEVMWGEQRFAFDGRFTPVLTARSRKLDAHFGLLTPWEYLQNTKLDLHFEKELEGETKASAELEYSPGNKILLSTTNMYNHEGKFFSTASLSTPFWKQLSYTLNLTVRPEKLATLVLTRGQAETTIRLTGDYQQDTANLQLTLSTPSLELPLTLEASYDVSSPSKSVNVAAIYGNKYEAKVTFSGSMTSTMLEVGLSEYIKDASSPNNPWEAVHRVNGRWQHQLETMPLNIKGEIQVDSVNYQASIILDDTSFNTKVVLDDSEGSLSARWLLEPTNSKLSINFQSPVEVLKDFNMAVAFDVAAVEGHVNMKYDTHELDFVAKMEGETFVFKGKTPFYGWEILNASVFASRTTFNAQVSRNERKIEVTGTQHLRTAKGKIELVVTTPYQGYETNSLDISYNFLTDNETVKLKAIYGTSEIFAKGVIKLANPLAPKVILNISTPFSDLRTLRTSAEWNFSGTHKTAATKIVYNEQEFTWSAEVSLEGTTTQRLASRVTTPFPGWTTASLQAAISISKLPYEVRVTAQKEEVNQDFSGKLMLNGNTIQGQLKTPIPGLELVEVDGTYTSGSESFFAAIHVTRGSDRFEVNTNFSLATHNPKLKVEVVTPFAQAANLKLEMEARLSGSQQKTLTATFSKNNQTACAVTFTVDNKTGFVSLSLKTPLPGFTTLEVEGSYDLRSDVKKAELNVTKEGERQHFALGITLNDNHVVLDVVTPFSGFQVMKMDADYTNNAIGHHIFVANFVKDQETYNFQGSLELRAQSVEVRLTTPITPIRHVVVDARYNMLNDGGIQASIRFERNSNVFEFRSQFSLSQSMSSFSAVAITPVPGWNNMAVDFKCEIEANKLSAEASLQREDFRKEVKVEATYDTDRGSLMVRTPVASWETLSAEYMVTVVNNRQATAIVKVTRNNSELTFSAKGQHTDDSIALIFQTPFQGYEIFSLEANFNLVTRSAKANLQAGSYTFSANASYIFGNMFLEVTTPFPTLRFGSVAVKHTTTPGGIEASLTVIHNKSNYFLSGEAVVAPRGSLIILQTQTPIIALRSATLKLQYNLNNKAELLTAQLTANDRSYGLVLAGDLQEKQASLKMDMTTPFSGWTQVKFESKVDLTQDDKMIEVVVEREGNVKAISVHGKLIGYGLNFDLRTPFAGLNRLNVSGNINRAKRSIEFQMMNDVGHASILTSFDSVKLELKTPFDRMEEMSFEVKKEDDGYKGHWKMNQNYVTLDITRNSEEHKVSLEIRSELNTWEFLAIAGHLSRQTQQAYVRGQINESKIELAITGARDEHRRSMRYNIDLKTPCEDYQHVTGILRFNRVRREIRIGSNSSNFKIDLLSNRRSGIQLEVIIPNPTQETNLSVNLTPERGNIDFTSRFELLRSIHYKYSLSMTTEIRMTHNLNYNGEEIFTLEFHAVPQEKKVHLDIHGRLHGRHTNLHIHREGFQTFNIILKREVTQGGSTTEKEMSMKMTGSGNLPEQGTIDAILTNSFVEEPRNTTIHAEFDRTSSPKRVNLQVTLPGNKLYAINLKYNIDLGNTATGDFEVAIVMPGKKEEPWHNFSGSWDVQDPRQTIFEFGLGGRKYKGEGNVSLLDTNLVFSSEGVREKFYLQWRFISNNNNKDYFLKVGRESAYNMLKLKGTIDGIQRGNAEGGFKFFFQTHELLFTSSWERGTDGTFNGQGNFTYGQFEGTHMLNVRRDAANKSAKFEFSAASNHPRYERVSLTGNYDVLDKFVFKVELEVNGKINRIDIDISNLDPDRSRNSIEAALPFLPREYQVFRLTLKHNLRNMNKFIKAEAKIGQRESYIRANWNRSDNFRFLEGNLEISSIFIGNVSVGIKYNVSNINNANAEIHYKRAVEGQPERRVDANWTRKKESESLEVEVKLTSTFEWLSSARAFAIVNYAQVLNLNTGVEFNDKSITITLNANADTVNVDVATPFEGFESIKGKLTYNLRGRNKKVILHYERGSRQAHMELNINKKSRTQGKLTLNLTSPFDDLRVLNIDAIWDHDRATVNYVRNNVSISMEGTAEVSTDRSEFNLSFTTPSGKAVTIAASYNLASFFSERDSSSSKLVGLTVDMGDPKIMFELKGFRNPERLYVEMDGNTSFLMVRTLHLKLDSRLNTQERQGTFEFQLNDFVFEIHNEFHSYIDGYYIKSRIESSLTPLPALVFGLGRRRAERIFTLGYGEEKELTFSIKAKNDFRSGFSGKVDIPNFGYDGVLYDVTYNFPSDDKLKVVLRVKLGKIERIEADFEYNSEGVKARLMTPLTGDRSLRMIRSISADSFYSEVGFDDYNLKLRGGFKDDDIKRGLVLEADILGRQFLFNYQFQSEGMRYTEGKLILQTPFRGWEKMGGVFTFSNVSQRLIARAEAFIPFFLNIPRVTAAVDLDLTNKIEGEATLDVAGERFMLMSNLVGASLQQGYQGSVRLQTPFLALPSLEVAGKVKITSFKYLEADLEITNIHTTYEVDIAYELTASQVKVNATILPGHIIGNKISLLLESLTPTQKKMELRVDDNHLVAQFKMTSSAFTMNLDTLVAGVQRQLSVNTRYSTLDDLEGEVIAILGEHRHKLHAVLSVAPTRVRGELLLDSVFIGGIRKLEFNASVPNMSFEQVSFSVSLTAIQVHSFSMEMDTRAGVVATADINTPVLPTTTVNLQLTWPRVALTVATPSATHTAAVSWRQTHKMPADQIVNAELDTPLLGQRYAIRMVMGGGSSKAVLKAELEVGSVTHHLEANTFMGPSAGGFSLDLQTPYMNIQKGTLRGSLDISDSVELQTVASMADVTNTFMFMYNDNKGTLLAEAVSPYIPTGMVKAMAEISNTMPNTNLQVTLMNAQDVISGRLDMKLLSSQDVTIRATLSTPLEGLKTVNGVIKYQQSDVTHVVISLDNPINFRAAAKFANTDDKFSGNVTIKTSITNLEYVEADVEIPLTEFSPRATLTLPNNKYGLGAHHAKQGHVRTASATFYLNEEIYSGNFSLRNRAPYELAYKLHVADFNTAFHLRTDSSFFTLLM